ncbi:MAG TPA: PRC-barrel domain-containing protein [Myxococcota bacterium]|nr:PRC-barrel domain-containing protein [Myxococcota bacterium]HRY93421.1 PRC-barrel domain-containing protein [Myxococcota bacterium]HSA21318.1 PRC-barrel domain-containing protein [Myxococcota bacterium]
MTLRLLQDIQGMQVVSLAEGRALGLVQKVFLNPAQKSVCGLLVRQPGLGGAENWIDIQDVDRVGEDVVFVGRAAACKAKPPVGRSLKELMGMPVATRDGKLLGSLIDVEIDDGWQVKELILSEGRWVTLEPATALVGQDTILLPEGARAESREGPGAPRGLLARMFGSQAVEEAAAVIKRAGRAVRPQRKDATPVPGAPEAKPRKKSRKSSGQ